MEIGVDIIEIDRIERLLKKYPSFRHRVFTDEEIGYCEHKQYPAQHFAARFAAKESIMKALGSGWGENLRWKDLEIAVNEWGKPFVQLHGSGESLRRRRGIKEINVSLSHCKSYAVAIAQVIAA